MPKTAAQIAGDVLLRMEKAAQQEFINAALGEAQQRQQASEEQRAQDLHDQQLQFNEDKHEMELQQLQLNLQQAQESFSLKQQQQSQREEDAATAKREGAVAQQEAQQAQAQQEAQTQQQTQTQQQDVWRKNIMAKAAAFYDEEGQPISLSQGVPSALVGAGMGGGAAHYLFPHANTKKYREMSKAITPEQLTESFADTKKYKGKLPVEKMKTVSDVTRKGNKLKFNAPAHIRKRYFGTRALQSNAGRLLKGTGLGLLAGLVAHSAMES